MFYCVPFFESPLINYFKINFLLIIVLVKYLFFKKEQKSLLASLENVEYFCTYVILFVIFLEDLKKVLNFAENFFGQICGFYRYIFHIVFIISYFFIFFEVFINSNELYGNCLNDFHISQLFFNPHLQMK